jgi:glycosyltransferase involved in cell wall biosynthesis
MRDFESLDEDKISVINQGFDFSKLDPNGEEIEQSRSSLDFRSSDFNVICIARYSKTKGQEYLVEAVGELIREFENLRLTFIGPGDAGWLIDCIESKGLKKYIRCLPTRNDIAAVIAASDLVVHPSLVDSFSQLIIEVQGVGTPLVATDIAAAREQIVDGRTGLIVPPRDSASIANGIKLLYLDKELRERMGKAARDHVRQNFTLDRMYVEQMACYQKVLYPTPKGK